MFARIEDCDRPLTEVSVVSGHMRETETYDFFAGDGDDKCDEIDRLDQLQGFNYGDFQAFLPVTELGKDVYVSAAYENQQASRRHRRRKRTPAPECAKVEGPPIAEVHRHSPPASREGFAEVLDDEARWRTLGLYGLAGLAMIIMLEQVYSLGCHRFLP